MNQVIKHWGKDLLSISLISVISIYIVLFLPIYLRYDFIHLILINGTIFTLVAILYRKNLYKFIIIIIVSVILSNALITFYSFAKNTFSFFYIAIYIENALYIAQGAIAGFVIATLYYFAIGNHISKTLDKIILYFIFTVAFICLPIYIANSITKYDQQIETLKEKQKTIKERIFFQRIADAIGKNQLTQFNNKELIDLGIISGIYRNNGEKIVHDYRGSFYIKEVDRNVDLIFEDIPLNMCTKFLDTADAFSYGFYVTKIDGLMVDKTYSSFINSKKECDSRKFLGKEKVTIEFIGQIQSIHNN